MCRKLAVKQKRGTSEPVRLGKRRYKAEPLQVQLTEEVTGSIRQLKVIDPTAWSLDRRCITVTAGSGRRCVV